MPEDIKALEGGIVTSDLENLLREPAQWLSGGGEESEMVLSCRARIARNLDKRSFNHSGASKELLEVREEVKGALAASPLMKRALVIDMDGISEPERMILAERHLITLRMVKDFANSSLAVKPDETLSVMINEEDHLRLQSIGTGLSMQDVFGAIERLDNELDRRLSYAFSERVGYLTACPTNVGTGLRVSAMVHLPGLVHNKDIGQVLDGLTNVRLTVRGIYGEGTEYMGNFFQISNSITLGQSEADTVKDLEAHIRKVLEFERKAREVLLRKARSLLEDKIWRAYGILKTARLVTSKEAMSLVSAVRMGVGLGIITDVSVAVLNELLIMIQPMHLQRLHKRAMGPEERDAVRADHIRAKLAG
jgi:protein arginine kinase